jgi:hypothetical protein
LKYSGTKDNKLLFFDKTFQMDLVRHWRKFSLLCWNKAKEYELSSLLSK